jgi:hypothetical protein
MRTRSSMIMVGVIVALAVGLILVSTFLYFLAAYQSTQLHVQATATTAAGKATSIAQVASTARAKAHATATVGAEATSAVAATQVASGDLYVQTTSGTPSVNDSLHAQSASNWSDSCSFANGVYDGKASAGYILPCTAQAADFKDLVFQVEMNIVSGHSGGIIVRADASNSGYYLRVSTDGVCLVQKVTIKQNVKQVPLFAGQSPAVGLGNNQFNVLTAIIQGSELYMYVNQQFVAKVSDSTYTSGRVGVFVDSDAEGAEVQFRNAQVWKL